MNDWFKSYIDFFESYVNSFPDLSEMQRKNFQIKKEHSLRVVDNIGWLGQAIGLNGVDERTALVAGLFHDIGRFKQLAEFNTFNDDISVDHADYSILVLKEKDALNSFDPAEQELIFRIIQLHNKFELPRKLSERELLHARLLRDADKLDIFKVLTDYYLNKNQDPNHTLTWELPKGVQVSPAVANDVLAGRLILKNKVNSEIDVKIMQLSWVYDLNFKPSYETIFQNRYLEKIYGTLPKNDMIIEIYRKIKVFAENKLMK